MSSRYLRIAALCAALLPVLLWTPAVRAQAPPPPPPAEGLDPATAPQSSRETATPAATTSPAASVKPAASPAAAAQPSGAPPPPPAEGLDPATAPASSIGTPAPPAPTGIASPVAAPKAAATPAAASQSDDVEVNPSPAGPTDNSPAAVFNLDFMQRALYAGLIVGGACGFLGVYVVLRRIVFVGVALAEMSSAGVALASMTQMPPMIGSLLTMLAGVVLFSVRWGGRRIRQDAFIGIGYVVASAATVLLLAKSPSGDESLMALLRGDILTVSMSSITSAALVLGATLVFHALFYKEMLFVAFDPDTAAASGYRSRLWELSLYLTIGLTVAFSILAVGVLLTVAALIIPAVTALMLTRRMASAFAVSALVGMIAVPLGLYLSYVADLPSAATVVGISFVLLLIAGVVSRLKGHG